jgi:hypothetical protein
VSVIGASRLQGQETMMVNHPARSQKTADAALRRLLTKHSLQRIKISVSRDGIAAIAMPDGFHPAVAKRREDAFAGKADWTLKEASEVQAMSMGEVARAFAPTLDEAIAKLAEALKA